MKINTHAAGHILVRINRDMLFNASGGSDMPPMSSVIPRATSREIYTVTPKAIAAMMVKG